MKPQNMYRVANLIERNPEQFDMQMVGPVVVGDRQSLGCIGGFCKTLMGKKGLEQTSYSAIAKFFGIGIEDAHDLAYAGKIWQKYKTELGFEMSWDVGLHNIKPENAVMLLRKLAKGEWALD